MLIASLYFGSPSVGIGPYCVAVLTIKVVKGKGGVMVHECIKRAEWDREGARRLPTALELRSIGRTPASGTTSNHSRNIHARYRLFAGFC